MLCNYLNEEHSGPRGPKNKKKEENMRKTATYFIATAFSFAAYGTAWLFQDELFDIAIERQSYLLGEFAVSALGFDIERRRQDMALHAGCGNKAQVELMLDLGLGDNEYARQWAYLWAGSGLNPALFPQCQTTQSQKQEMLRLIEQYTTDPEEHQKMLDATLEQIVRGYEVETARYLLERGANPDRDSLALTVFGSKERSSQTLAWAAENETGKAQEMVELLLQYGADPELGLKSLSQRKDDEARQARELIREKAKMSPAATK